MYEALVRAYGKFADLKAQGTRPLVDWKYDEGFKFPAKGERRRVRTAAEARVPQRPPIAHQPPARRSLRPDHVAYVR